MQQGFTLPCTMNVFQGLAKQFHRIRSFSLYETVWLTLENISSSARKNAGGASAAKVPTVSGIKEFERTKPIVLAKTTKQNHGYCESVNSVHRFRCRRELGKIVGATTPKHPVSTNPVVNYKTSDIMHPPIQNLHRCPWTPTSLNNTTVMSNFGRVIGSYRSESPIDQNHRSIGITCTHKFSNKPPGAYLQTEFLGWGFFEGSAFPMGGLISKLGIFLKY